ncbi:MAG: DUF167 domain-containing protein [bacterium]
MYIKVVVKAGSKKENFVQKSKDHFEISVKEKAENNMANKRIIEILALYFKVSIGKVRIINGHHHPHKLLVVDSGL